MTKNISLEQQLRDILERMGIDNAQSYSAGELGELAQFISNTRREREFLESANDSVQTTKN